MQSEDVLRHKFIITNYQNKYEDKKVLGKQKNLFLCLYDDYMIIKEESPNNIINSFFYRDMPFLQFFNKAKDKLVFIIRQKKYAGQPTGSFRQADIESCKIIYDFVNKKIELNSDANQTEILFHKKNIINSIKAQQERIYKQIYTKNAFSSEWLDSVLFEDHEKIKQFNALARVKAHENQRKLLLARIRDKKENQVNKMIEPEVPLEKYDFDKINEGTRFHDDYKKVSFVPKEEDKEEDLIVEALPNEERVHYIDTLDQIKCLDFPMEIESEAKNKVVVDVQKDYEQGMRLPRPEKDKFKLFQSKDLNLQGILLIKPQKKEFRQFNLEIAQKTKIWIKLFYQIQHHSQVKREHISVIESQLYNLLNSEPRIPLYLERAIKKTHQNITEWKRNQGKRHVL